MNISVYFPIFFLNIFHQILPKINTTEIIENQIKNNKEEEEKRILLSIDFDDLDNKIDCKNEKMAYNWQILNKNTGKIIEQVGKQFDCKYIYYLNKYKLTNQIKLSNDYKAKEPGEKKDSAVFVTASDKKQFDSVIALIGSIKHRYGKKQKIIVYDLGGILQNEKMINYLNNICEVECREFKFKELPSNLRDIKKFAWKIFILAQLHSEFNTFIYVDNSVRIYNGDFKWHINNINKKIISPFLFNSGTHYGIKRATWIETFKYLPLYLFNEPDIEIQETNFIIIQQKCFEPKNFTKCNEKELFVKNDNLNGICHQYDKSILNILINNAEEELISNGNSNLIIHSSYNHPSRRFSIYPFINYQILREHRDNTEEGVFKIK
ncbi:hypothetical protein Mgra_00004285 [Meloidogyne graminicola]|uniref:Uncharacterized protein n=1 Tax=Meloidogyne graminicola TaxID=189291 RepID=A0A8S9ZSR4_9BILA|nr:hypothetical protein Mgra_00004285 [Meloidogyne graminicola]